MLNSKLFMQPFKSMKYILTEQETYYGMDIQLFISIHLGLIAQSPVAFFMMYIPRDTF